MYIGLDLGTSGVKAALVDEDETVLAEATAPLTVARPHPGWSEQSPADWLSATEAALTELTRAHAPRDVRAIGLSGQMHGATLLDRARDVLRPCMLWNDTRAHVEAAAMDARPEWRRITGNIVFPGFTAPKLEWVRRHEPEIFSRVDTVLLPKDYLRLWLTGDAVSDMSDASGTGWLDVGARDWSDELLAASGLSRDNMPALVEGSAPAGRLREDLARRWGLGADVIVAGGGGDNAASGVGVGAVAPGRGFVSLGTSGVIFAASDGFQPDPGSAVHTFCHALPDLWHQMGVILSCTDAVNWFAGIMGREVADLTGSLGPLRAPGDVVFLPYLGGERTPHNDAAARGVFAGLGHATDRAALTRAVLEGVCHAFRDNLEALRATGTQIDSLLAVGGGTRSEYWLRALATALDMPLDLPVAGDFGGAFGAARLARMAAAQGGASLAPPPRIARTIAPDPALTGAFAEAHRRYRATYSALRGIT
ncbi:MAG: xylulokinase [Rhodobacteraceae bacterium]|nr:xylulokinase [Paracoccaceae bacterium]